MSSVHATFGYSGEIPVGWVRDAYTGEVNKVCFRQTSAGNESESAVGQGFGALYSCRLFGAQLLQEQQEVYDLLPASVTFEFAVNYELSTQAKEGLYIGADLQFECFQNSARPFSGAETTIEESASITYSGGFVVLDRPTSPVPGNLVANYQSMWGTSSTVSASHRRESSSGITFANFQMRCFYLQENYHAGLVDMLDSNENTATYNRRREVFAKGLSVYLEHYVAASNAYKLSVPKALDNGAVVHGIRKATGAPFGKRGHLKLLLSIFDQQGVGEYKSGSTPHYYWGDAASVTAGAYQLLLDTDGTIYDNIPTDAIGGSLPIVSSFNNDVLGADFVVINANPMR